MSLRPREARKLEIKEDKGIGVHSMLLLWDPGCWKLCHLALDHIGTPCLSREAMPSSQVPTSLLTVGSGIDTGATGAAGELSSFSDGPKGDMKWDSRDTWGLSPWEVEPQPGGVESQQSRSCKLIDFSEWMALHSNSRRWGDQVKEARRKRGLIHLSGTFGTENMKR